MAAQAALYGGMAALQLASGYFASQNIKATAELNRDIAEMNAEFAEWDAYDAEVQGQSNATRYQSVIDNTLAEQRATLLAQDVDINYGSAASIAEESTFNGQLNLMEIEKQAQMQALGYNRQARDIRLGSTMDFAGARTKGGQVLFQGITQAADTGLTGYTRSK